MAGNDVEKQARGWLLGGWVWLAVGLLNLVIVGLRLAAGWPPTGANRTAILLSGLGALIAFCLSFIYRRKARAVAGNG